MLCKPFFYRAAAYMNAICLFGNIVVFIILEIFDSERNILYEMQLYGALFAIKIVLSQLVLFQISYFRNPKYHSNKVSILKMNL